MSNNCQSSGPVGTGDGVMTPRKKHRTSGRKIERYWLKKEPQKDCETTVCVEICAHFTKLKKCDNFKRSIARWERAKEPLVLVAHLRVPRIPSPLFRIFASVFDNQRRHRHPEAKLCTRTTINLSHVSTAAIHLSRARKNSSITLSSLCEL